MHPHIGTMFVVFYLTEGASLKFSIKRLLTSSARLTLRCGPALLSEDLVFLDWGLDLLLDLLLLPKLGDTRKSLFLRGELAGHCSLSGPWVGTSFGSGFVTLRFLRAFFFFCLT